MEIVKSKYEQYIGSNLWKIGTAFLSLVLVTGFLLCFAPTVSAFAVSYILTPLGILISLMYLLKIKSWFSFESGVVLALAAWLFITRIVKTGKLFSFANEGTVLYVSILLICFLLGYTTLKEEQKKAISILAWVTVATVVIFDIVGLSAVFFVDYSLVITDYGFLGLLEEPARLFIIDHPNTVGMNSAVAIVAAIFLVVDSKSIEKRIMAAASIIVLFPTLSITVCRNSYYSLAVALGVFAFIEVLINTKKKKLKFLISVVATLAAFIFVILVNKTVTAGMSYLITAKHNAVSQSQNLNSETESTGLGIDITTNSFLSTEIDGEEDAVVEYRDLTFEGGLDGFLNGRWSIWKSALRVMANSSAKQVTIGLNSISEFKGSPFCSTPWANHTHNSLVNATVLNGVVALALIVIFLCLIAMKALIWLFTIVKLGNKNELLAFCISIIVLTVLFSLVEIPLFSDGWFIRNTSQLWFVLAAGVLFMGEPKSEKDERSKSKLIPLSVSVGIAIVFLVSYLLLLNNFRYHDLWKPTESGATCYSKCISDGNIAEQEVTFDGNEIGLILIKTGTIIDGVESYGDVLIVDIVESETDEIVGTVSKRIRELNASGYTSLFPQNGIQIDKNKQYRVKLYTLLNEESSSVIVIEADYCDRSSNREKAYYNGEHVNEMYAISFFGR